MINFQIFTIQYGMKEYALMEMELDICQKQNKDMEASLASRSLQTTASTGIEDCHKHWWWKRRSHDCFVFWLCLANLPFRKYLSPSFSTPCFLMKTLEKKKEGDSLPKIPDSVILNQGLHHTSHKNRLENFLVAVHRILRLGGTIYYSQTQPPSRRNIWCQYWIMHVKFFFWTNSLFFKKKKYKKKIIVDGNFWEIELIQGRKSWHCWINPYFQCRSKIT